MKKQMWGNPGVDYLIDVHDKILSHKICDYIIYDLIHVHICDMYLPKDRTLTSQVHACITLDVGCTMLYTVYLRVYITSLYQLDYYEIMCLTILHTRSKSYTRKKILVWLRCHLLITKIALVSNALNFDVYNDVSDTVRAYIL